MRLVGGGVVAVGAVDRDDAQDESVHRVGADGEVLETVELHPRQRDLGGAAEVEGDACGRGEPSVPVLSGDGAAGFWPYRAGDGETAGGAGGGEDDAGAVTPFEEMLRNVRSSAWMVVFWTLSAVPVVVVSVLFGAVAPLVSVTAMVPPAGGVEGRGGAGGEVHAAVEADGGAGVGGEVDAAAVGGGEVGVEVDGAAGAAGDLDQVAGGGLGDGGVDGDVGGAAVDVDADAGGVVGGADGAAVDGDGAGGVGDVDAVAGLAVEVDAADGQ